MTKIVALRAKAKKSFAEREGVNLTYLPFIARAVDRRAQGASEHQRELQRGHQGDHLLRRRAPRLRGRHRAGPALPGRPQRRRPVAGGPVPGDLRHRRAGPVGQPQARRAVRRHVHHHQHRQPGRVVRHPDPGSAAGRDAGHRRHRQAAAGGRRRDRQRVDRRAVDLLPAADLRPPSDRRRGRRPLPDHDQEATRRRGVRGRLWGCDGKASTQWPSATIAIAGSSGLIGSALGLGAARRRPPGAAHRPTGTVEFR